MLDGIVPPRAALAFAAAVAADAALAAWLSLTVTPWIGVLAAVALAMAAYAGFPVDAKRLGLGELAVAVVWGPVMAGGTLLAMGARHTPEAALVYAPYAATVSLVLIGKHWTSSPWTPPGG